MASKPKRADVGRQVAALADKLSDSLLQDEFDAKEAMEALFSGALARVAGLSADCTQAKLSSTVDALATAAAALVDATQAPFTNLCSMAARKALDSIGEELDLCESTLAKRYAGISDEAVVLTRRYANQMVMLMSEQYLTQTKTAVPWFRESVAAELQTSLSLKEPADVRLQRLIAPEPIRVPSHAGRGLWWKVLEQCNRTTREAEIACVNAVREHAMKMFNEAGAERDGPSS